MKAILIIQRLKQFNPLMFLSFFFILHACLQAQWSKSSTENDTIAVVNGNQSKPVIISNGEGGAIIVWQDERNFNSDLYTSLILPSGKLSSDFSQSIAVVGGDQISPVMIEDGEGGAFITWQDDRNSPGSNFDIYAQKIDLQLGRGKWAVAEHGLQVQTGNNYILPNVIRDSMFGAIIGSYNFRDGNYVTFLQKVNNSGTSQWETFTRLSANQKSPQPQEPPAMISDGNRGVIVVWCDKRESTTLKMYAERLDESGKPVWPAEEVLVGASISEDTQPAVLSDASGGIFIAWIAPDPIQSSNDQILIQRINAQGEPQLDNSGRTLSATTGKKEDIKIVRVNQDTLAVLWVDLGSGQDKDIRIQRINTLGQETEAEFDIVSAPGNQVNPSVIPDKRSGIIIAWEDNRSVQTDIYAQLIEPNGTLSWGTQGIAVSTADDIQRNPVLTDDKLGGAIIAWEDRRNGTDWDIYAQKVSAQRALGEYRSISISAPKSDAVNWEIGSTQMVQWTFLGEIDSVSIELSRDGGLTYKAEDIISKATSINTGALLYKVTGPASTNIKIRISATNAEHIYDESDKSFTISNPVGPSLSLSDSVAVGTYGDSLMITAAATDISPIKNVILNFRKGGARFFQSLEMDSVAIDSFQIAIPANFVTERGVEYYVSSQDTLLNFSYTDTFYVQVKFESNIETKQIFGGSAQSAYRMISAPNLLDTTLVSSILSTSEFGIVDTTSWRLFIYQDSVYIELDSTTIEDSTFAFTPGQAFWLISRKDRMADFGSGLSMRTDTTYTILLKPGWNQIGLPFAFPVSWEDILAASGEPPGISIPDFYSGQYLPADTLNPYEGYFIKNPNDENIKINFPPVASEDSIISLARYNSSPPIWAIQIKATCEEARDTYNFAGIHEQASTYWDKYDYPEPPPVGEYVSIYFPRQDWHVYPGNYTTDYRKDLGEGLVWSFNVKTNIANAETKLTFSGLETLPQDVEIWLLDEKINIKKNLRQENDYSFPSGNAGLTKSLKLVVGRKAFVANEFPDGLLIPDDFELAQNFPNPFNPVTAIRYGLPTSAKVRLQVYDLLGRLVTTLIDGEQKEPGFHLINWDSKDKNGKSVASGLYIYRLEAGEFTQTKKMLLVK